VEGTKPKKGPYGEPIYPEAEEEMRVASLVRYRVKAELEDVGRFYEEHFAGVNGVFGMWADGKEGRTFSLGIGPRCTDYGFTALVVMVDHRTRKKRRPWIHILVNAPDAPPETSEPKTA